MQFVIPTMILAPLLLALVAGRKQGRTWAWIRIGCYAYFALIMIATGLEAGRQTGRDDGSRGPILMLLIGGVAGIAALRSLLAVRAGDTRSALELDLADGSDRL